jgi:hypothetical protein
MTLNIGDKCLVRVKEHPVIVHSFPAKGLIISGVLSNYIVLLEEIGIIHEGVCYFDLSFSEIIDNYIKWIFSEELSEGVPVTSKFDRNNIFEDTYDNILFIVGSCVGEMRNAKSY